MKTNYISNRNYISITLRCLYIITALIFSQSCSEEISQESDAIISVSSHAATTQTELKSTVQIELINQAKQITKKYKLSELSLTCLKFDVLEKIFEGKRIINVHEKHEGSCGGDPDISPRLFSIGIEQSTGIIWSDARSMLGQLEKLEME